MSVDYENRVITTQGVSWTGEAFSNKKIQAFFDSVIEGSFSIKEFKDLLDRAGVVKGESFQPTILRETEDKIILEQVHPIFKDGKRVGTVHAIEEKIK